MDKRGWFFREFLDNDRSQRGDIEDASSAASNATDMALDANVRVGKLEGQLRQLATVLDVLMDRLEHLGLIDEAELRKLAVAALAPAPRPAPEMGGQPDRGAVAEPSPAVICAQCAGSMPRSQSNITFVGTVCDRCFATASQP